MKEKKTKIKKDLFREIRSIKSDSKNTGITLIALIITIIVLLILAGVVINMTIGNEGIIGKAQSAVDLYKNEQEKEKIEIAKVEEKIDNYLDGSRINVDKQYGSFYIDVVPPIGNSKIPFQKIEGNTVYDSTNNNVKLLSGKHYYITFSCRTYDTGGDCGDFIIFNETDNTELRKISWCAGNWIYNTTNLIYTPSKDVEIYVKNNMSSGNALDYLYHCSLSILEI